jgi:phosphatidylserine/phosphatidylglycerophosphate/cardiolipin synthase-like enzyme
MTLKTNNPSTIVEAYEYVDKMWETGTKPVTSIDKYYERFVTGTEYYDLLIQYVKNADSIKVLMFEVTYNFEDPNSRDSMLLQEILNAYNRGAQVELLFDDPRYLEVTRGVQFLTENNVPFKVDDKKTGFMQKIHAKAFLIDDEILFIGSQNWSADSLGLTGEASVITRHPQTVSDWLEIFDQKWTLGHFA